MTAHAQAASSPVNGRAGGTPRGTRRLARALAGAALLLLAACADGPPPVRHWLIEPVVPAAAPAVAPAPGIAVEITDLLLPQYLDRFRIARRNGANELVYAPGDQWSENLRKNLLRVLAGNLGAALATRDISTPEVRLARTPQVRVRIAIDAFERGADGIVRLRARWQVTTLAPGAGAADAGGPATGRARIAPAAEAELQQASAADIPATVEAMQQLFGELSLRIAGAVRDALPPAGAAG